MFKLFSRPIENERKIQLLKEYINYQKQRQDAMDGLLNNLTVQLRGLTDAVSKIANCKSAKSYNAELERWE